MYQREKIKINVSKNKKFLQIFLNDVIELISI